jgi:hypothetical protein
MPHSDDWYPAKRASRLAVGNNWIEVLSLKGTAWGVPATELSDPKNGLIALVAEATGALAEAMSSARTSVTTAHCEAAFDALEAKSRYIKKHYFLVPPLTNEDLVDLGLVPADTTRTPQKTPVNQPGLEWSKWGPRLLGFRVFTALVLDASESGYGVRVFTGLVKPGIPAGEAPTASRLSDHHHLLSSPPLSGEDLPDSFFTRRGNDLIKDLPAGSSGLICYAAAQYEIDKGGAAGPFGPMIQTYVP